MAIVIPYNVTGVDELIKADKALQNLNKTNDISQKEVDQTNKKLKEQGEAAGKTKQAFSGLGSQLQSTANRVNVLGVGLGDLTTNLGGATKAIGGATKALRVLKIAVAATGIGALVLALGSLVSFFTGTQRGADRLNVAFKAIGATVDVLRDRLSSLGEAITLVFQGQFTEALDQVRDSFRGIGEEILNEAAAAGELERATQALQDREIDFIKTRSELRRIIELNRLEAEDEAKSNEERAASLRRSIEAQNELTRQEIELATERARILEEQVALGESTREDFRELAEVQARVIDLETERARRLRTVQTRLNAFTEAQGEARESIIEFNELLSTTAEIELETSQLQVQAFEEQVLKRKQIFQGLTDFEIDQIQRREAANDEASARGIMAARTFAKEGSNFSKALALFEIFADTRKAVQRAIALSPLTFGQPWAGFAIATGAINATAVVANTPQFAEGGLIDGPLHSGGGVDINAEGGEFILRRKAVDHWGVPFLEMLNKGMRPQFITDNTDIVKAIKEKPVPSFYYDERGAIIRTRKLNTIIERKGSGRYAL